jgi:leucyl/phenylalanyl-tRNA--protein transferase
MIVKLNKHDLLFPSPELAAEDGWLAVGGDLSPERLMVAYNKGIFPWYNEPPIRWYSPHERFVLLPSKLKISKSMAKVIASGQFKITFDQDFGNVIRGCSMISREGQAGTWINSEMQLAYLVLHRLGYAHSVEVWSGDELVGGLYGVVSGNIFCGESMFSKVSNASKAALIWLCQQRNYKLIDCQIFTEHLSRMGAEMISREEYMSFLKP